MIQENRLPPQFDAISLSFWVGVALGSTEAAWILSDFHAAHALQVTLLLLYAGIIYGVCCAITIWLWLFAVSRFAKQTRFGFEQKHGVAFAFGTVSAAHFVAALVRLHQPHLVWLVPGCLLCGAVTGWIVYGIFKPIPHLMRKETWMRLNVAIVIFSLGIALANKSIDALPWFLLVVATLFSFVVFVGRIRRAILSKSLRMNGLIYIAIAALPALPYAFPYVIPGSPSSNSYRPNVLLISVDTLRKDHLGCYAATGNPTPEIDKLAKESVLFEDVVAPVGLTGPSHVTMLSGLYPVHHRVISNAIPIPSKIVTLPEVLSEKGYRTGAVIGGYTLTDRSVGLSNRFHHYDDDLARWSLLPDLIWQLKIARLVERIGFIATGQSLQRVERPAEEVTKRAVRWILRNQKAPFFLFVHYFDPHGPRALLHPYQDLKIPFSKDVPIELRREILSDSRQVEGLRSDYKDEIRYTDSQVGQLIYQISHFGFLEKTIILFTSDHGESLSEHNYYFEHALSLYEGVIRVPLLIRFPNRQFRGMRLSASAQLSDLAPTILDWLNIPFRLGSDGQSLIPFLGSKSVSHPAYGAIDSVVFRQPRRHFYVRWNGYKLLWFFDQPEKILSHPTQELLFDLKADPGEENNMAASFIALKELRQLMGKWAQLHEGSNATSGPEDEVTERLRALGYL